MSYTYGNRSLTLHDLVDLSEALDRIGYVDSATSLPLVGEQPEGDAVRAEMAAVIKRYPPQSRPHALAMIVLEGLTG